MTLQNKLVSNPDHKPKCTTCLRLLSSFSVEPDHIREAIEAALNPQATETAPEAAPEGGSENGTVAVAEDRPENSTADKGQVDETVASLAEETTKFDAVAWMSSHYPDFVMLENGQHQKKFPVRCRLCTTRSFPMGKVIDLCALKKETMQHFLNQHISSGKHQRALQSRDGLDHFGNGQPPGERTKGFQSNQLFCDSFCKEQSNEYHFVKDMDCINLQLCKVFTQTN